MKGLSQYVCEDFVLKKKGNITQHKEEIPVEINTGFVEKFKFDDEDINVIQQFAQSLKVSPVIITNTSYFAGENKVHIYNFGDMIYVYFEEKFDKGVKTYISFEVTSGEWQSAIILDDKAIHKEKDDDLKTVCDKLFEYLNTNKDFYNKIYRK